jgi:hypothetical protein
MTWLLVALVLLVLVLGAAVLMRRARDGDREPRPGREPEMRLPEPRCLRCHGTGWLNRDPERTFTFTGDGFEDRQTPATMCPACGGTGRARRRPEKR